MAKKFTFLLTMLVMAIIIGQGCYTIIQHPSTDYVEHSSDYYVNNCLECHEDYHEYPYGFEHPFIPGFWHDYDNWGYYNTYPWWWEKYWWDVPGKYSQGEVKYKEGEDQNYNSDDYPPHRRGLPDYTPGTPAGIEPGTAGGSSGGGISTGSGGTSGGGSQEEQAEPQQKRPERRRLPDTNSSGNSGNTPDRPTDKPTKDTDQKKPAQTAPSNKEGK